MANPSLWPVPELILVFRHGVVSLAIMIVVWANGEAAIYLVPAANPYVDLIDMYVLLAVLVLLAVELLWGLVAEFLRGIGFNAILVA
jgi:hypothetical protein